MHPGPRIIDQYSQTISILNDPSLDLTFELPRQIDLSCHKTLLPPQASGDSDVQDVEEEEEDEARREYLRINQQSKHMLV